MIKVRVSYPRGPDTTFDIDCYVTTHMPMVKRVCGDALKAMGLVRISDVKL